MLEAITPKVAKRAIDLAKKFSAAGRDWDSKFGVQPGDILNIGELGSDWLMGHFDLDEHWALYGFLSHLGNDRLAELKALMWLGSGGTYETKDDWPDCVKYARDSLDAGTIEYMMGKTHLADDIENGLKVLGY